MGLGFELEIGLCGFAVHFVFQSATRSPPIRRTRALCDEGKEPPAPTGYEAETRTLIPWSSSP
jgi:hypothetical protein